MAKIYRHPSIFGLSNPTSRAECTAKQAYDWSNGKAIFTSGSPFGIVEYDGEMYRPGLGNNAYIFQGIGLGSIAANASKINDKMFLASAKASLVIQSFGCRNPLPPLTDIRDISLNTAIHVADKAYEYDLARDPKPRDLKAHIQAMMYNPVY